MGVSDCGKTYILSWLNDQLTGGDAEPDVNTLPCLRDNTFVCAEIFCPFWGFICEVFGDIFHDNGSW